MNPLQGPNTQFGSALPAAAHSIGILESSADGFPVIDHRHHRPAFIANRVPGSIHEMEVSYCRDDTMCLV